MEKRIYYPGALAVPLVLVLMAVAATANRLGIIQVSGIWSFWPVSLIAAGIEELYLWATSNSAT
jgi:hypothetical protein